MEQRRRRFSQRWTNCDIHVWMGARERVSGTHSHGIRHGNNAHTRTVYRMLEHFVQDTFLTRKIFFISCLWCSLVVIPCDVVVLYLSLLSSSSSSSSLSLSLPPPTLQKPKSERKNLVNHAHVSEQVFHKSFRLLLVFSYWDFFLCAPLKMDSYCCFNTFIWLSLNK